MDSERMKKAKGGMKAAAIVIVIVIIVGILALPSITVVRTEEVAVVRTLGAISHTLQPGMNFVFWVINDVERFDLRIREMDLSFSAHSTDAQVVHGQVSIQYQLDSAAAMGVAQNYGSLENLESMLYSVLLEEAQNVFTMKSAMELVRGRADLASEIQIRLGQIAPRFHVTITNVALEGMAFGEAFEQAIEQVAIADQALRQAELDALRNMVYANQALDVSRLEAEAVLVAARADAEALAIMQDAWGDLGTEIREIMLRQLMIDNWDGALPQVVGGGDNMGFIIDGIMN